MTRKVKKLKHGKTAKKIGIMLNEDLFLQLVTDRLGISGSNQF